MQNEIRVDSPIYEKRTAEKGRVLDIFLTTEKVIVRVFIEGYKGFDEYTIGEFFDVFTDTPVTQEVLPKEKTVYRRKENADIYYVHSYGYVGSRLLIRTVGSSGDVLSYTIKYFSKNFEEY